MYDVIVIGGGTAGLVTASGCARLGRKVALIERSALGGDCLWTGCVPTKALVASARLAHQMRNAAAFGLTRVEPAISPRAVMESMRAARKTIEPHDSPAKFRALGIDVISGEARLAGGDAVEVRPSSGADARTELVDTQPAETRAGAVRRLAAKDIVIATGSRTAIPPVKGLREAGFIDHASFLERNEFPASVVILGGGYIGIEFAQVFRRFGCDVTVVDMVDDIINKEDHEVITLIRRLLIAEGIRIETSCAVEEVRVEGGKKIVTAKRRDTGARGDVSGSGNGEAAAAGGKQQKQRATHPPDPSLALGMTFAADEIFVASGRRGNTEGLGLDEIGVNVERSYIAVDRYLQTSVPRVWACGDVHGGMQFTHVAAYEGIKLVRNMLFPGKSAVSYDDIPWALYTDPEVGHIGMTQRQAEKDLGRSNVRTYRAEMIDVDRAVVDRASAGFVKFVCDRKGRILGAHAVCTHASSVIEEIVLARKKGVRIGELAQLVSSYPSLSDGIQNAAAKYYEDLPSSWIGRIGKRVAKWSQ